MLVLKCTAGELPSTCPRAATTALVSPQPDRTQAKDPVFFVFFFSGSALFWYVNAVECGAESFIFRFAIQKFKD